MVRPSLGNSTLSGLVISTVRPSATSSTGSPWSTFGMDAPYARHAGGVRHGAHLARWHDEARERPQTSSRRDRRHLIHPYQVFDTVMVDDVLPIERGAGARIVDSDGREYIDAVGGMWCTNIGLGRDEMADAIAHQVRELAYANPFVDMTNVPAGLLCEKLASLTPGDLNRVFLSTGGSTAVDAAYRLIQFYQYARGTPEKRHVLSRVRRLPRHDVRLGVDRRQAGRPGARASTTSTTRSITCRRRTSTRTAAGAPSRSSPTISSRSSGPRSTNSVRTRSAAFFAEPIMGSGGVIMPPADYLRRCWQICRDERHRVRLRRGRDRVRSAGGVVRLRVGVRHRARHHHERRRA